MSRGLYLAYLSVFVGLTVAGFFLPGWAWWAAGLVGVVAMLPVVVTGWVHRARRRSGAPGSLVLRQPLQSAVRPCFAEIKTAVGHRRPPSLTCAPRLAMATTDV